MNAKQSGCEGPGPHLLAVAVVSVPSRLPKTIWAPESSLCLTASKYVAGSGTRSGVSPSIMSPTAARVTEAAGAWGCGACVVALLADAVLAAGAGFGPAGAAGAQAAPSRAARPSRVANRTAARHDPDPAAGRTRWPREPTTPRRSVTAPPPTGPTY